jgi:hypothetical protein
MAEQLTKAELLDQLRAEHAYEHYQEHDKMSRAWLGAPDDAA